MGEGVGVSIILCTYNGKERLTPTFGAIWELDQEVPKELIVVDNASSDGTGDWVQSYFQNHPTTFSIKYLPESKPGLLNARLAGIQAATYDILLFCDDDNELFPDYLSIGYGLFRSNSRIGVLGGKGGLKQLDNLPDWFSRYERSFAIGSQAAFSGKIADHPGHVYGAGSFFRKQPLLELIESGYQFFLMGRSKNLTISGDDLELCWLMQLMGYEIHFEEKLKFYHAISEARLSTQYLLKMKSGTAVGGAFLFAYRHFFRFPQASSFSFSKEYLKQRFKADLIYFKNRFGMGGRQKPWEKYLALSILDARRKSFSSNYKAAKSLFEQLKSYQTVWKLNS